MMNTSEKGNMLEDKFYEYLVGQQSRHDLVFGAYPPNLCKIFKKRKYYCKEREADVEFDVVIELYRQDSSCMHLAVVFECKNHVSDIAEIHVNDFSNKLGRVFKHGAKGVIVVSSRLQSGAANVAKNGKIGIVKYDENGIDVIADRKGGFRAEKEFVRTQIFKDENPVKSLKFSAYHDGSFFGSIDQLLMSFDPGNFGIEDYAGDKIRASVPYTSDKKIQQSAQIILDKIDYKTEKVDLAAICSVCSIDLELNDQEVRDGKGQMILGSANFDRKSIRINLHDNPQRERFTLAHEIGHICLQHDRYLRSETIVERDLLITNEIGNKNDFERLEFQANAFASHLLLPEEMFKRKVVEYRKILGIRNRGFGYIYVDDQLCNYRPYNTLLIYLSSYFDVSKQAVEIKFKKLKILTDQRRQLDRLSISQFVAKSPSFLKIANSQN